MRRRLVAGAVTLVVCSVAVGSCGTQPAAAPAPGAQTPFRSPTPPVVSTTPSAVRTRSPSATTPPTAGPSPTGSANSPSVTPTQAPAPTRCAELAASLSLRDQVGQLIMVAVSSGGVTSSAAAAIEDSRAGSVILLGNTTAGSTRVLAVTEQARDAARTPKKIATMLAADQEGGLVQRLQGRGFDRIPSAQQQARLSPAELTKDATTWGKQLKRAGIDANLAPVADVVPRTLQEVNQPIGVLRRGYGSNPSTAATHVTAFIEGMDAAGVATSVKHFPGLGRVRGNTDFTARVVDNTTTDDDAYLQPFDAGVQAGADMVMMSSATYTRIDPKTRAAFSRTIVDGLVRGAMGFDKVIISDDLAARAMQDLSPGTRMLRFLRAGGDLAIIGDPSIVATTAEAVVDAARDDDKLTAMIEASTVRVLQLKDRRGLARC